MNLSQRRVAINSACEGSLVLNRWTVKGARSQLSVKSVTPMLALSQRLNPEVDPNALQTGQRLKLSP